MINDIINLRFNNQRIAAGKFKKVSEVVQWFGAVQAQEYPYALWSLSLRMQNTNNAVIESEFNKGSILRTHVMRPTWHFVCPQDIRWLLMLTAPRVKRLMSYYNKRLSLTEEAFQQSNQAIAQALQGGKELTRSELSDALVKVGIPAKVQKLAHLMMQAELDGIICSGANRGKQFTYALLDEKVPPSTIIERDEALQELTKRYFQSHGPATIQDFSWWSGLTMVDAKKGIELNRSVLITEEKDNKTYWFSPYKKIEKPPSPTAYLMSIFDEYLIAYKNRDIITDPSNNVKPGNALWNLVLVIDGKICGKWRRILKKEGVVVDIKPFKTLTYEEKKAVKKAMEDYAKFLGLPLIAYEN